MPLFHYFVMSLRELDLTTLATLLLSVHAKQSATQVCFCVVLERSEMKCLVRLT